MVPCLDSAALKSRLPDVTSVPCLPCPAVIGCNLLNPCLLPRNGAKPCSKYKIVKQDERKNGFQTFTIGKERYFVAGALRHALILQHMSARSVLL